MRTCFFSCDICKETEENSEELIGLSGPELSLTGFNRADLDKTETHICIDCLEELRDFLNGGCK